MKSETIYLDVEDVDYNNESVWAAQLPFSKLEKFQGKQLRLNLLCYDTGRCGFGTTSDLHALQLYTDSQTSQYKVPGTSGTILINSINASGSVFKMQLSGSILTFINQITENSGSIELVYDERELVIMLR